MASHIKTDDPKHHKYVSVNKVERKKFPKRQIKLLSLLFPRWMHEPGSGWNLHWRREGIFSACHPYLCKGMRIIYDDCNHKTYRVMVKTMNGWMFVQDTFKYEVERTRRYYYYSPKFKSVRRLIRSSFATLTNVKHYKRGLAY